MNTTSFIRQMNDELDGKLHPDWDTMKVFSDYLQDDHAERNEKASLGYRWAAKNRRFPHFVLSVEWQGWLWYGNSPVSFREYAHLPFPVHSHAGGVFGDVAKSHSCYHDAIISLGAVLMEMKKILGDC